MRRVLLTDGFLRKTLAATRDLGRDGIEVTVGDAHRPNPSAWSKYCSGSVIYPHPITSPSLYLEWLEDALKSEEFDVFMPMDDAVMDIAVFHQRTLRQWTKLLVPHRTVYEQMRDKGTAQEAAHKFGFKTVETFSVESTEELAKLSCQLTYPVVVKPRRASGSRGFRKVDSTEDLMTAYQEVTENYDVPLVQRFVPLGDRIDVCLLMGNAGELLAGFAQRELRHFPHPYGPSTAQESVEARALIEQCTEFAQQIGWSGILELEFMQSGETGDLYFMEANTRFWNSLHLAIISGVRFPLLLFQYLTRGQSAPLEQPDYQVGVRCRNLIPSDTLQYFVKPKFKLHPPSLSGSKIGEMDDIISRQDMCPSLGFSLTLLKLALTPGELRKAFKR